MNVSYKKQWALGLFFLLNLTVHGQALNQCSYPCPSRNSIDVNGSTSSTYEICSDYLQFHVNFGNLDQSAGQPCAAADCGDTDHGLTDFALYKNGVNITTQPGVTYSGNSSNCYMYTFTISKSSPVFGAGLYNAGSTIYQMNYTADCLNRQLSTTGHITVIGDDNLTVCNDFNISSPYYGSYPLIKANVGISAGTTCFTTVRNGTNVGFRAGQYINLGPGFTAEPGSMFFARIGYPCLPGNQRIADVSSSESGTSPVFAEESINNSLSVYPNPNNGKFVVNLPESANSIALINSSGNTVYNTTQIKSYTHVIDVSEIMSGIYYLKITYSSGKADSKKIVVQ